MKIRYSDLYRSRDPTARYNRGQYPKIDSRRGCTRCCAESLSYYHCTSHGLKYGRQHEDEPISFQKRPVLQKRLVESVFVGVANHPLEQWPIVGWNCGVIMLHTHFYSLITLNTS